MKRPTHSGRHLVVTAATLILLFAAYGLALPTMVSAKDSLIAGLGVLLTLTFGPFVVYRLIKYLNPKKNKDENNA